MTKEGAKRRGPRPGRMTSNRRKVLRELAEASKRGERITLAELARRCGLYDYRNARRTVKAIRRYGMEGAE